MPLFFHEPMRDPKEEIKRQLDAVVGESYEPPRRWGATLVKWAVFAMLAIVAAVVVVGIIDTHVTKAQKDAASKRPIPIHIIPAK
jgi:hypothetical protein